MSQGRQMIVREKRQTLSDRLARPSKSARGLSRRVRIAVELMVRNGLVRKEAAAQAGLKDGTLYHAFLHPEVKDYYNQELAALRRGEAARNLHTGIEIRDDQFQPGKTRIEAAKYLDGNDRAGVTVNVGVGMTVNPGYVTVLNGNLAEMREILQRAGSTKAISPDVVDVAAEEQ